VIKSKNFLGNRLLLAMKKQDFVQLLIFGKLCKISGSGTETETFPKSELEPQQIITVPHHRYNTPTENPVTY
jgi:hypothetical protein